MKKKNLLALLFRLLKNLDDHELKIVYQFVLHLSKTE